MDNTSINVTDVNTPLAIPSGQFLIYGNKPSTVLQTANFALDNEVSMFPNPAKNSFSLNINASKIEIFSMTGQLVKQFNGNFDLDQSYDVNNLNNGIYIVKVIDTNNKETTLKLIKQ